LEAGVNLAERLAPNGFLVVPAGTMDLAELARPWAFADTLTGSPVRMVERQMVRVAPHGKSFASTNIATPLHNDLQLFLGRPADLQVLFCARPARAEGEGVSLLLDTWRFVESVAREDPPLLRALFEQRRVFPFVAGTFESPTVARFGDRVSFLHSPRVPIGDALGARILERLAGMAPARVALRAQEVLVVDNHRVLHGRTAFSDSERELVRLLVWLVEPRAAPSLLAERAVRSELPGWVEIEPEAERALGLVLRMVAGNSPGALAARAGQPEPRLYELRDGALGAALAALRSRS
jgi:gamma-butyrobetaine dioxygenase